MGKIHLFNTKRSMGICSMRKLCYRLPWPSALAPVDVDQNC